MSAREWKPGDVARLTFADGSVATGVRTAVNDGWHHSGDWGGGAAYDKIGGAHARPLVVIDPEDREEVERLGALIFGTPFPDAAFDEVGDLQAALREFADPKPPKPEEPTGLGAVVEDAEGRAYIRVGVEDEHRWMCAGVGSRVRYGSVDAVRVLSEGVQ